MTQIYVDCVVSGKPTTKYCALPNFLLSIHFKGMWKLYLKQFSFKINIILLESQCPKELFEDILDSSHPLSADLKLSILECAFLVRGLSGCSHRGYDLLGLESSATIRIINAHLDKDGAVKVKKLSRLQWVLGVQQIL